MSEDFFAELQDGEVLTEETVINEEQQVDEPAESQPETVEVEEAPSHQGATEEEPPSNTDDDNNVPLNKNPRFQEVIREKNELLERVARLEEARAQPAPEEKLPDWFKEAYGEDANAWNVQQRVIQETAERVKREMMEAEQKRVQAQQEHQARWDKYVADQVAELEGEGKKFDKNELLKIALEYQPTDAQGNVSLKKSYDILEMRRQAVREDKTAPKKAVAGLSSAPSRSQPTERDYVTAEDLRGKSFRDFIR